MKSVLSWLALAGISNLTVLTVYFCFGIGCNFLGRIVQFGGFGKLVCYVFGILALVLIFILMYAGCQLSVSVSEKIKKSKRGMRYILFAVFMLAASVIYAIIDLSNDTNPSSVILCGFYCVRLIRIGKSMRKQQQEETLSLQ